MGGIEIAGVVLAILPLIQLSRQLIHYLQDVACIKQETINHLHHIGRDLEAIATLLNGHEVRLTARPVAETIASYNKKLNRIKEICLSKALFDALLNPERVHEEVSALQEDIHHTYQVWQLEMQVHTTTLVSQVREEHLTGITKQTDALAGLAGEIEHIKHLLSCAPSHSQQPRSRVQEARVPGQGPNFPPQSTDEKPQEIDDQSRMLRSKMTRLKVLLRKDGVFGTGPRTQSNTRPPPPEGESAGSMDGALATVLLLLDSFRHSPSPTEVMTALRRLTRQLIDLQLYKDALEFHSIALRRLEALAHRSPAQVAYDMPLALATQALLLRLSERDDDAREAIRRAIPFAEGLSGDNGKAMTAICFKVMAWVDDYSLEAAAYLERAIAIYWHLIARYPSRYLVKYLESLSLLGKVMLNAGDTLKAIAVLEHAVLFGQHLDRPHHQPIKEHILTRLDKALQSAGKGPTTRAAVSHSKDVENPGDGLGGAHWCTRRLLMHRRKNTSIDSTGDSHSRLCNGISSALDIIRSVRPANTRLTYRATGDYGDAQYMQHNKVLIHCIGKKGFKRASPDKTNFAQNLNVGYGTSESHSERMVFLDSLWREMDRLFQERPRHRDDPVHRETKKKLYMEEITSTVSWKTVGSSQILFAPTITHQFTLYTPVEDTYEATASVTYDYLVVIGLQDEPVGRSARALTIPERKRHPGWI